MQAITIEAEVGEDHRLIYKLPPDTPVGKVILTIQPIQDGPGDSQQLLTRDEASRRLLAAGKLLRTPVAPVGSLRSSDAEDRRLSELFGSGPSVETLIDQDRGSLE